MDSKSLVVCVSFGGEEVVLKALFAIDRSFTMGANHLCVQETQLTY
jgi:hypothetical protein